MPIRVYECNECGYRVERLEYTMQDGPLCPRCELEHSKLIEMTRQPAAPAVHFAGEGWCRPASYTKPQRGPEAE